MFNVVIHVHYWCSSNVSKLQIETWKKLKPPRREITRKQDFESLITNASENLRSSQNFPRSMCFKEPFYTPNIILSSLPLPHVLHRSQFSEKKRNGKWHYPIKWRKILPCRSCQVIFCVCQHSSTCTIR